MGIDTIFDSHNWARVPFHFWSAVFFVLGCIVGSFLNVCIHRLPRGQSIVSPPSHCPHCGYSIPWHLNIPLVTWLELRGKCRNCGAPISFRYFFVELLSGTLFLACWVAFGHQSVALALVYCVFLAGLIVASLIDIEHFVIPDEITLGGIGMGFICSLFLPAMHHASSPAESLRRSFIGIVVGAGLVYLFLRLGKVAFGRQRIGLAPESKIIFTEHSVVLPNKEIPYEELFYRHSDVVALNAQRIELVDRCYQNEPVRLALLEGVLRIGEEEIDADGVHHMEVVADKAVLPREVMGPGDVKLMAGIGAFLGWQAVVFALTVSSIIGATIGLGLIVAGKRTWSSRMPYGPYIAIAAAVWVFGGGQWWIALFTR
jgi:leader peptidase (prepilin peptidase)/N-methyltransferase